MAQRICPKCGHVENEYTYFCTECGAKTELQQGGSASSNVQNVAPVAPVKVEQPVAPVKVEQPVEPVKVEQPVEPVKVEQSVEPVKSEQQPVDNNNIKKEKAFKRNTKKFEWKKGYTYAAVGVAGVLVLIVAISAIVALKPTGAQPAKTVANETSSSSVTNTKASGANNSVTNQVSSNVTQPAQTSKPVQSSTPTQTTQPAQSSVTENNKSVTWKDALAEYIEGRYTNQDVIFFDLNGDEVSEAAVYNNGKYDLLSVSGSNDVDILRVENSMVAYQPGANMLCTAYCNGAHCVDNSYFISNGKWEKDEEAECYVGFDERMAEPDFEYYINGRWTDNSSYYNWLTKEYQTATNIEVNGYVSASEACRILRNSSGSGRLGNYSTMTSSRLDEYWEFYYSNGPQIFVPNIFGTYFFQLKGAAGGADGQRVIDGTAYYDATGAELEGTVFLGTGERVVLIVGGAGGVSQTKEGVVPGGFNGGGDTYWSGGGGGCTDVYRIDGVRLASAAGAGGGNYDRYGEPGRESTSSLTGVVNDKRGGGTGYTMSGAAGAGGGAGWYGGAAGANDDCGHGGISGYNDQFFSLYYELPGHSNVGRNEENGSATVTRIE